jgi:hypothetical protein
VKLANRSEGDPDQGQTLMLTLRARKGWPKAVEQE